MNAKLNQLKINRIECLDKLKQLKPELDKQRKQLDKLSHAYYNLTQEFQTLDRQIAMHNLTIVKAKKPNGKRKYVAKKRSSIPNKLKSILKVLSPDEREKAIKAYEEIA